MMSWKQHAARFSLLLILGIFCALAPIGSATGQGTADSAAIKSLEEKLREELAQIRRAEEALPAAERLTAWELDFRGEVLSVAPGRECFYYLLHLPNALPDAPGRKGALSVVSVNQEGSDSRFAVVCVDLKTGRIRWSREINGLVSLAVAPDTDVLHLYRERLVKLAPDSGAVIEEFNLPERGRQVQGLLIKGKLVLPQPHSSNWLSADAKLSVFEVATKTIKVVKLADYWLLAPDESRQLVLTNSAWHCLDVATRQPMWSAPGLYDECWLPFWNGSDAVFTRGNERQLGLIKAIDSVTGTERWSARLGWGIYESGQHQLRGGGYPDRFRPVTLIENRVLALDGSGRLYFLNPTNGQRMAAPQLDQSYLEMPVQFGEQLIVCSQKWLRSYSLSALLQPETSPQVQLQLRKAKSLLALRQNKEALEAMDWLVARTPELSTAWAERARVCEALGDSDEEVFSRSQALVTSHATEDESLRGRWGLMRLYHFEGKPGWPVAHVDGHVYAGTLAGSLWSVQADNLDLGLVAHLDHEITAMAAKPEIQAVLGNSTYTRRPVTQVTKPFDDKVPREWYTEGSEKRFSAAVQYRGRRFRSMVGGVRVLSGTTMQGFASPLKDLGEWSIHQSPFGPLGYGAGVFELDTNLCPVKWLIRPTVSGKTSEPGTVEFMASSAQSLGLIVGSRNGTVLQTYTRAGEFLNEMSLGPYTSGWANSVQLVPLGNGFLFSDRQLAWLGATKENRAWRFGPSLGRTSTERWGERWRYFGDPLILNGCLYVTGLDGSLYVFDTSRITEMSK